MSHVTKLKLRINNFDCLRAALERIKGSSFLGTTTVDYYNTRRRGVAFELPGFVYPITIDKDTNELYADMYGGQWGDQQQLDQLMQYYAAECAKSFAAANNYSYQEQTLEDGKIRCTLTSPETNYYETKSGY